MTGETPDVGLWAEFERRLDNLEWMVEDPTAQTLVWAAGDVREFISAARVAVEAAHARDLAAAQTAAQTAHAVAAEAVRRAEAAEAGDPFYCWGAAVPEADGWINPSKVSHASGPEGARHRADVLGKGYVVVRRRVTEWTAALRAEPDSVDDDTAGVTSVEPGCTCGGMAACPQCQDRDSVDDDTAGLLREWYEQWHSRDDMPVKMADALHVRTALHLAAADPAGDERGEG